MVYLSGFIMFFHFNEWFIFWVSMELVMYGFLILSFDPSNIEIEEACYKYFFVQSLGSGALLGLFHLGKCEIFMEVVLFYKIGLGPFYYWYVSVIRGLSWGSCYILMTAQKVIPLFMLREMDFFLGWIMVMISFVIGLIGSLGQVVLKDLMVYSSLHYMGWLLLMEVMSEEMWVIYFFMYSLMLLYVVISFFQSGVLEVGEMKGKSHIFVVFSLFVMGGVPPFMGFILKWVGFLLLWKLDVFIMLMVVVFSVIMCYVYFRIGMNMILMGSGLMKLVMVHSSFYFIMFGIVVSGVMLCLWGVE